MHLILKYLTELDSS